MNYHMHSKAHNFGAQRSPPLKLNQDPECHLVVKLFYQSHDLIIPVII